MLHLLFFMAKEILTRRKMLLGLTATAGGLAGLGAWKTFHEPGTSQPEIIKKANLSEPTAPMSYSTNKKNGDKISLLGFGCMRFPVMPGEKSPRSPNIDAKAVQAMVDYAIAHGVNYFDTGWGYHSGASQAFIGRALKHHPRDKFNLATKMPGFFKPTLAKAKEYFASQLKQCQVEYFDYYLLHALSTVPNYKETYEREGVLDYLLEEKKQGRIRNLGWSFHGDAPMLEYVLNCGVPWDFGMVQLNYHDMLYKYIPTMRMRRTLPEPAPIPWMYSKMVASGLPMIIMEPLLGGRLARLNGKALRILQAARPEDSAAAWAFRYVAGLPNVLTILSGMTYMEHLQDNLQIFSPLEPLTPSEELVLKEALNAFVNASNIRCTTCGYCMPCPYGVDIPGVFRHHNNCLDDDLVKDARSPEYNTARQAYLASLARKVPELATASHCTGCGQCISKCPQFIDIPNEMDKLAKLVRDMTTV